MASEWFYMKDGQQCGPIGSEELKGLAASGQLQPTDMVWKEGMAEWVAASKLKGVFPEEAKPATPPPPPPPATARPPQPPPAPSSAVGLLPKGSRPRILLIIASSVLFICFFLPLFYVSVGEGRHAESSMTFGFGLWYGIVAFILGIVALAAAILDLVLSRNQIIKQITKWAHLGCYGVAFPCSLLGVILSTCGIGMSVYVKALKERMPLSDVPEGVSSSSIPIMAPLLVIAAALGLILALKIVRAKKVTLD